MENLVQVDRETPFLLPQDLRDWVPENHIAHFIIEAVSYKYAKEQIEKYGKEVDELLKEAEKTDSTENEVSLPKEIALREERIGVLKDAVRQIEEAQKEIYEHEKEEYERKLKERKEKTENGKTKGLGRMPKEPEDKVDDKAQVNFTDGESRIMKFGNSRNFEQCYNLQAAVDTDTMLIVGTYPTQKCNDKMEIKKCVESIPEEVKRNKKVFVCADTGYFSGDLIESTEKEHPEVKVICATERAGHGRTVEQILEKLPAELPEEKPGEAMTTEKMRARLRTGKGQEIYSKRKTTVEPAFGIIKRVMGFRQFLMRGLENIGIEWDLVTISYNLSRMYSLKSLALAKK